MCVQPAQVCVHTQLCVHTVSRPDGVTRAGAAGVPRRCTQVTVNSDLHIAIPVVCCSPRTDFQSFAVRYLFKTVQQVYQKKRNQSKDGSVTKTFTCDSNSHEPGMVSPAVVNP